MVTIVKLILKQYYRCSKAEYSDSEASVSSTADTGSVGNSDSGSSVLSWTSTARHIRRRQIDEILDSLPFFFGSMLDDPDLQTQLLAEPGDAFLVSYPLIKNDAEHRCTAYRKWHLVILEPNEIIFKIKVIYRQKFLRIASERNTLLLNFINDRHLKMINRPWIIRQDQITPKMPIVTQQAFPIDEGVFALGKIEQKTLNFDALRRIPVIELLITDCTHDEISCLLAEAQRRKRFGSVRIWRLWGICEYNGGAVSLILEDIVYGSVAEYVRVGLREYSQLCQFAVQIAEGLRYLEKYGFIHRRLTVDACMLTYDYNVKIAIYGLTAGELYPTTDDLKDVDRCRWIPPECLPHPDGPKRPYDSSAVVYSFGTVLWSMFHGAAMPYEDEQAANIIDRNYRSSQPLFIDNELVPEPMREVILRCWNNSESIRGRFRDLKWQLRKVRDNAAA
uniref:Protein kinase domain-containing protein n=1 Tax=Ascaris lumbricoides TaxID=6252 RepID=A0A9J2PLX0_ASCLU